MRYHVYTEARHPTGAVAAGHSLAVYDDAAGTQESDIYAAASGGSPLANPYIVPATGVVDFWTTVPRPYIVAEGDSTPRPAQIMLATPAELGLSAYDVREFGAWGGAADGSAALLAALAEASAATGGTILLPAGPAFCDSQIVIPNEATGDAKLRQKPIAIVGAGALVVANYESATDGIGGTMLDLRYSGAGGKIETLGWGSLDIRDLCLAQNADAGDTTPLIFSSRTVTTLDRLTIRGHTSLSGEACIQDAIQFGDPTGGRIYEGYGSQVGNVTFDHIRSGLVLNRAVNDFRAYNCTWTTTCGSNNTHGAIDVDGSGDQARNNLFVGMTIECMGYPYAVRLKNAAQNTFIGPGFWDSDATLIACVKLEGTSPENLFINPLYDHFGGGFGYAEHFVTDGADVIAWVTANTESNEKIFTGGWNKAGAGQTALTVRPDGLPADGVNHRMLTVRRSMQEAVDPNLETAKVDYGGRATFNVVTASGDGISIGWGGLQKPSGNLDIYAGPGGLVYIARGLLGLPPLATEARPEGYIGIGACYYDTTLQKPVFSDGHDWRDAAGNIV